MARLGLSSLLLLALFRFGDSFYFELSDKSHVQRCFLEEVDESTTFKGIYKVKNYHDNSQDPQPGAVFIRVMDPNGQDMVQREYKNQGSFAFFSGGFGTYEICFLKVPTEADVTTRVYLHYEILNQVDPNEQSEDQPDETSGEAPDERQDGGSDEQKNEQPDVDDNGKKENNTRVESKMERLLVRVDDTYDHVWKMYLRFKKREKEFRELSKTTNNRIIWWAILQVIVLVLTAAWQMRHLTRFFILKKIV